MEDAASHDRILILDFGSQVTQLIARRLREAGIYCEIFPYSVAPERIAAFGPCGIIFSGGPASVTEPGSPRAPDAVFVAGVPILGICYGQQALVEQLGGRVERSDFREFGRAHIDIAAGCALFDGAWTPGTREQVWMSHEPRRPCRCVAARFFRSLPAPRARPSRLSRMRGRRFLRRYVPPGGGAHAARGGAAA